MRNAIFDYVCSAPWFFMVGAMIIACSQAQQRVVEATIEASLAACVAENPTLGDVELQTACRFADDLWPIVRRLIAAHRTGAAKVPRAPVCADAGKD